MTISSRARLLSLAALVAGAGSLTGCTTWDKMTNAVFGKRPDYVIHLHTFTGRRTDKNEMSAVEFEPGKFAYLDRKPLVSSVNATKIEIISRPRGKSLKLTLDGHGRTLWTQTTARHRNKKVIVMLDKTYKGWIQIDHIEERGVILLPGPFTDEEIENIKSNAERNREKF